MKYSVHATASFFDQVVEHTFADSGQGLVIGNTPHMAVPVPEGQRYLAKVIWKGRRKAVVIDGERREYLLEADGEVVIASGPVKLSLRMVPAYRLRRMASLSTVLGTAVGVYLLTLIMGSLTITTQQVFTVNEVWCETWIGEVAPPESLPIVNKIFKRCTPLPGPSGGSRGIPGLEGPNDRIAEYLERILRDDLDGEETGQLAQGDRQFGDQERHKDVYMPAGDRGPHDAMGGAAETELRAVRVVPEEVDEKKQKEVDKSDFLVNNDVGTPVDLPGLDQTGEDEGEDELVAEAEDPDVRKEDRVGWGVRDWYDQDDVTRDAQEVRVMKDLANRILAINPDDPEALSILAYYQYLSEDNEKALTTYDRYIELNPEEPAGYNNKALIYKRQGKYDTEEALYRIALTMDPTDTTALNNLAVNLSHQERFDEALQIMKDLEVLDPGDAYADLHRSKIYAEMGRNEEAFVLLEKALRGMKELDTLHHIEFRQDIRIDPSFEALRKTERFRSLLWRYYGDDTPIEAP
ncbi:MAG: hypothetical protein ACI9MC_003408 [Kiritimatiellia bacterium]|jgi:hypothetical protein